MSRSYPSWIAGLKYRGPDGTNRRKYCAGLRLRTVLSLVPEPENPHSENGLAVAVKHAGLHLGYIPSRHNWIGRALESGKSLTCVIDRVETEGWLFRRARFVGLTVTVTDIVLQREEAPVKPAKQKRDKSAEALRRNQESRARELCINGLRVLAHIALSDDELTKVELAVQATYIETRLESNGFVYDAELIEGLVVIAQGLAVPQRAFVRALNAVSTDKQNFAQVLAASLRIAGRGGSLNHIETSALEKIQAVGKTKGWL